MMKNKMKKILIVLSVLSVLMFTNVFTSAFASAFDVRTEDIKKDKQALMKVLENGQCGTICVRYERNRAMFGNYTEFGFCRATITVCKD